MRLNFELTLSADYHISAGQGGGMLIDSALLRDGDGVLVLRGSTLEGLLRDGLWRLLQLPLLKDHYRQHMTVEAAYQDADKVVAYCRAPQQNPLDCPLCRIFGTPAWPKRWCVSSARPSGAKEPLYEGGKKWKIGQTGAQPAARVRISPRTRRAEARKLFIQEEGDARLVFCFTIEGPNDEHALIEAALLVAATRMVRRLGAARRRGRGECQLRLRRIETDNDIVLPEELKTQEGLLEYFERWLNGESALPMLEFTPHRWQSPQVMTRSPVRRRIILRTDEPVILANRTQAGNTFETADYIQGGVLLGALANRAARQWNLTDNDSRDSLYKAFLQVFKRDAVRFSMLYPVRSEKNTRLFPAIPAPLDLLTCKAFPGVARNNLYGMHGVEGYARKTKLTTPTECQICKAENQPDVPLIELGGFITVDHRALAVLVKRRQELHPRTDPRTQRVATGNLFGYVSLEGGQWFVGEIWCRDEQAWHNLCQLTGLADRQKIPLHLGKATRRGHGLTTLWLEEPGPVDIWRGNPLDKRVAPPEGAASLELTLTLLTDTILIDAWGCFYQTFSKTLLQQLLKQPLECIEIINAYCRAGYVDNFNNKLGLPRWRDLALRAGSAVGIRLTPPDNDQDPNQWWRKLLAQLKELEDNGIGLRRQEGFGQVVFNHPIYEREATGIINNSLKIPDELQLPHRPDGDTADLIQQERMNLHEWNNYLHDELKNIFDQDKLLRTPKEKQQWSAIARWLYSAAASPVSELEKKLSQFGKPDCLTAEKRETEEIPTEKFGALLKQAYDEAPTPHLQRRRIEMLADHLAALAKEEEQ